MDFITKFSKLVEPATKIKYNLIIIMLRDGNLVRFRKVLNKGECQSNRSVLVIETIRLIAI